MLDKLGTTGILGVVLLLVGIAVVAYKAPIVAVGIALALVGLGLVAKGLVSNVMSMFGMA
ncbi:hypothetical protein SAMN04487950_3238 [Halogranum rubrum]|uniref:Uncharacterized protein n=2 Tax=Halogranum rubrum TaxID=553466 RepID=A0A1I4GGR0_9EURY|nr:MULTISPECIES: hypothetical protein [Halogranum]EJN59783.1 hypothetical protein HSB1_19410 [Halogranum salarium B-1]SFL28371.1 hypothetical protein SAMN04487950_3238 [Halogranum rubrum]